MKLELVSLISSDKLQLPGLLYTPDKSTKKAAVWLHGMGDSGIFYNPDRANSLGKTLTDKGIALLAFNNRGAHNRKWLRVIDETLAEDDAGYLAGTHYELIADCVQDIEASADFLQKYGFNTLYLMGHSTGANKVCAYHMRAKHNPFSKYVLAGPGDDTGIWYSELGDRKFWRALNYAKAALKQGDGERIMPKYTGMNPFSAQAAADILNPDGNYNTFPFYEATSKQLGKKPLFKEYSQIKLPMLVIFGAEDEYAYTAGGTEPALKILRQFTNPVARPKTSFKLITGADHSFHGYEQVFAEYVAEWLVES